MSSTPETLVFATNNSHKLAEARQILGDKVNILSLSDIGCHDDIPENADTLQGNALQKARWISERYGYDCFADDTGLEVEALDGAPGVHSARYSELYGFGQSHDSEANVSLLLRNLERYQRPEERKARFRTAVALIKQGHEELVDGIVEGYITDRRYGSDGFGYDPVFIPKGHDKTFAEMSAAEKNEISHRGRALRNLLAIL